MSTSNNSGGRPSAAVYRRRRLIVALAALAIVVAIVLIIVRLASPAEKPSSTTPPPSATSTEASTETPAPDASAAPTAEAGAPCAPESVTVVAATNHVSFEADVPVEMTMTVTNTGTVSCELNVGTAAQVFTVTSGSEQYWISTDCQSDPADARVLLEPGVPASSTAPVVWDRTRSTPETCDAERDPAPAGGASYHLTVSIDGIASEPAQFLLY